MLDFLTLRNALIGGGIGIVVLLTLIQITPIKLNPLSYIARKLGDALNASQSEKFESFKKQLEALDKKVEDLKNHVDESEIKTTRIKILRFADEIFMGKVHSYDAYKEVLHAINEYQLYCNEHPDFVNNMAECSIAEIKKAYEIHRTKHNFLMPIATEQSSLDEFTDKECEYLNKKTRDKKTKMGSIYFISDGVNIKIGYTKNNVEKRLK